MTDDRSLLAQRRDALASLRTATLGLRDALLSRAALDDIERAMALRSEAVATVLNMTPVPARALVGPHKDLFVECERIAREEASLSAEARDLLVALQEQIGIALEDTKTSDRTRYRAARRHHTGRRLETEG